MSDPAIREDVIAALRAANLVREARADGQLLLGTPDDPPEQLEVIGLKPVVSRRMLWRLCKRYGLPIETFYRASAGPTQ